MKKYKFDKILSEGIIISRPNRFIMLVDLAGVIVECHCPNTGRIGNIKFQNIPCLLSASDDKKRRTKYTVEAISLNNVNKKLKSWIGINQTRINRYIEFFLDNKQFSGLVGPFNKIKREIKLKKSRIDFLVGNTYLEVKMPLISLPGSVNNERQSKFNSFDRLIKHFRDLSQDIDKNHRAVVLLCYLYQAQPFRPPETDNTNKKIKKTVARAVVRGVEIWQANFKINEEEVSLTKYFRLDIF